MPAEERETPVGGPREPPSQGARDAGEVGGPPGDRHDGDAEGPPQCVQVEDVEPSHDGPVEQDRAHPFESAQRPHERDDPTGAVGTVDPDRAEPGELEALGEGDDDRRDRGPSVPSRERPVVDGRHTGVSLPERAP